MSLEEKYDQFGKVSHGREDTSSRVGARISGFDYPTARQGAIAYRQGIPLTYADRFAPENAASWRYGWRLEQEAHEGREVPERPDYKGWLILAASGLFFFVSVIAWAVIMLVGFN